MHNAPKGETCVANPLGGAGCYDAKTEKGYDKTQEELKGYIMRSPQYDNEIAEWCIEGWRRGDEER